jgi:glycosyltransferase involved in cell wall biosynthesis
MGPNIHHSELGRVAFLGNHPPRQCGIATFTADLSQSMQELNPKLDCIVVAMNDVGKNYSYSDRVRFQIQQESLTSYKKAADFLNLNSVDVVSLQHEYGIFGGKAGAHVLTLLRQLRMPIVSTLHTILERPSASQQAVMDEICSLSERIIVMSTRGAELLSKVHGIDSQKIELIPHGVPALPNGGESKTKLGLQGKRVLLTFGLLSPDKGIEYVIDALPAIVDRFPDVVYVVLGTTHPHVREEQGETYRLMLEARGHALGVDSHLRFHDHFATMMELMEFLAAADVYVTPYLNVEQITSGTLAYALGAGKAIVSSRYRYAEELLENGRGRLVPPRNSAALASEISMILGDPSVQAELEQSAQSLGQKMRWPVVTEAYVRVFQNAAEIYPKRPSRMVTTEGTFVARPRALPELNLTHLKIMTDDTGLLQHAELTVPRREDGYCLDDNARALTLLARIEEARLETPDLIRSLTTRYMAFVRHAFEPTSGRFRNFMDYSRRWTERFGSEDSHGRALWALGTVCARSADPARRALAGELLRKALPGTRAFTSPRAWAFSLLGVGEYVQVHGGEGIVGTIGRDLAEALYSLYRNFAKEDWPWSEDKLTYSNARIPQAMIASGTWTGDEAMTAAGLRSLEWLSTVQTTSSGVFAPIGTSEFFVKGGTKASFDQQPLEACGMIAACLLAYGITRDLRWHTRAMQAFNWFLGQNQLSQWVCDPATGGCRDGLHHERSNENQGAESTLSFLLALLDMRQFEVAVESPLKSKTHSATHIFMNVSS